jgi:NodT family efflux transporter outer membrane factor (OMF) lipoprotein
MTLITPMLKPLTVAVFAALLAACTVGPEHVRPTLDAGEQFARANAVAPNAASSPAGASPPSSGAPASAVTSAIAERDFWQAFGDPQLSALVDQTLLANHDLRIALSRLDAADALLRGAKFDRLPTLTASAGASDVRLSADQAPGASRADRDGRSYQAGVQLGWELDLFGRVRRGIEAQRADVEATAADLQALQVSLVAQVAGDYLVLRGSQERLRVATENARSQADTLRLVERGLAAGRGTEFDAARARAQLDTTSSRIPALQAQIAFSEHRLAVLSGRPPASLISALDVPQALPALPAALDPGTPGDLLRRRPDVAGAEARLHAATARIGVATADLFPRFTLAGLLGSQAGSAGALFERDSEPRVLALGVDWSFLDVGRVRARIAAADAEAAGELARYEQTVLTALEDTENALVGYAKAREEDGFLQRAAGDSGRAAQLARTRFEAGAGTLLEVLDAERTKLQAQDALAQSRTRSLVGAVALYRAMAGGWPNRLPQRRSVAAGAVR